MKKSTTKKLMQMVNELYENEAESFSKTRNNLWEREVLDFIGKIKPGSSVLDLGCGNARLLSQIIHRKSTQIENETSQKHSNILQNVRISYLGIDPSRKLIMLNRKKYGGSDAAVGANLRFEVGDGLENPLFAGQRLADKFDYIISIAVLHHVPSEELQIKFLKNIYNGLKKGGQTLISVWNRWQTKYEKFFIFGNSKPKTLISKQFNNIAMKRWNNFLDRIDFHDLNQNDMIVPWRQSGYFRFIHAFKPKELKNLAQKAGFKNIKVFASKHGKKTNLKDALSIYLLGQK